MNGVMIALLPITNDWSKLELPHLTLVYAGKVEDHKVTEFNELCKDATSLSLMNRPMTLETTGIDIFGGGEDEEVEVYKIRKTPELMAMRRFLRLWNASEHEFNPHVTIGPRGSIASGLNVRPRLIAFDRIMAAWGDDQITFNLRRG